MRNKYKPAEQSKWAVLLMWAEIKGNVGSASNKTIYNQSQGNPDGC